MSKGKAFIVRRLLAEIFEESNTISAEAIEYGMTQASMVLYWAATGNLPLDSTPDVIRQIQQVIDKMPEHVRVLYPPIPVRELTDRYEEIAVVPNMRTLTKQAANNA